MYLITEKKETKKDKLNRELFTAIKHVMEEKGYVCLDVVQAKTKSLRFDGMKVRGANLQIAWRF